MTNYSWAENTLGTLLNQKNNGNIAKSGDCYQTASRFLILLDYTFFVQFLIVNVCCKRNKNEWFKRFCKRNEKG